ncbi:MAG TPA: nickel-responsive transcriptional regulator NikR [Rhodospirillaceae bacterium]|nr:nickel-responsive transcriptional regulator NikR [Rhodospirillaceae bacterium]
MERMTISLDDGLLAEFDDYIRHRGYENRSEAIRDLLRERLELDRGRAADGGHAVGCLSYVYNHHQRELARRLTESQHARHDLMLSTLHVHLDHENCLEVVIVQGEIPSVRQFAEATIAETGVRHGNLHLVAADVIRGRHEHGHDHSLGPHHSAAGPHIHLKPRN